MQGRGNLTPAELHRVQGKCSYLCFTWNALLLIAVCPAQDALLGIVSKYKAGQTYKGQKKSYCGWNTKKSRQMWLLCLAPKPLLCITVCSARDVLLGIASIIRSWTDICGVENSL